MKENKNATFVHEIPLDDIFRVSDISDYATKIIASNSTFLDPQKVKQKQVEKLLTKMHQSLTNQQKDESQSDHMNSQ